MGAIDIIDSGNWIALKSQVISRTADPSTETQTIICNP